MNQERLLKTVLGPHTTEKSQVVADKNHQIVFRVAKDATKPEIKQAVEQTETIDQPRLLLIMEAQLQGSHVSRGYGGDHFDWLAKRLKVDKEDTGGTKQALILKKLPALSEEELRKVLVEFCLISLCYDGEIKGYKVQTTEKLNRMDIGVQVEKK